MGLPVFLLRLLRRAVFVDDGDGEARDSALDARSRILARRAVAFDQAARRIFRDGRSHFLLKVRRFDDALHEDADAAIFAAFECGKAAFVAAGIEAEHDV